MAASVKVLCLLFSANFVVVICDSDSKYAKDVNLHESIVNDIHPFRTRQCNLVWEKAKKMLGPQKLQNFHVDLMKHDGEALQIKKLVHDGGDPDGLKQDMLRQKFLNLMENYGMRDVASDHVRGSNRPESDNDVDIHDVLGDKKMNKLYESAKKQGFNDHELGELKEEMKHHKRKVEVFKALKDEVHDFKDLSDNSLEPLKDGLDPKTLKDKRHEMERLHKELGQNFETLHKNVRERAEQDHEFTEPRVVELWRMMKTANFSGDELASLKEELTHFQHRVLKHRHFTDEARVAEHVAKNIKDQNMSDSKAKHNKLWDKATEYGQRVKKYYNDLRHRVEKQLTRHGSEL